MRFGSVTRKSDKVVVNMRKVVVGPSLEQDCLSEYMRERSKINYLICFNYENSSNNSKLSGRVELFFFN